MSDPASFAIQVLFGVLFAWAAWVAVRHRDILARDVALVLAPIALTLVSGPVQEVIGTYPAWFSLATTIFLLIQPLFSLQLVADIRGLPSPLLPLAIAVDVVISVALAVSSTVPVALVGIGVFVVLELTAAAYLAIEAGRRSGAARVRLVVAALATAAIAGSLLSIGASAAGPEAAAAAGIAIRIVTLFAAIGFWIALLPPHFLRQFWQGTAALGHSERLFAAPPDASSADLWADLADAAGQLTGAVAVVVLVEGEAIRVVATSDARLASGVAYTGSTLGAMIAGGPDDPIVGALLARAGCRFGKVVALAIDQVPIGAIVLLRPRPSLFDADDAALVRALGLRSAQLVQRREVLAKEQALSAELARTVAALEAASAAKSDFLASMSHELRTPLNAIIGFSSLMGSQTEVDGALQVPREWVEHIRSGGEHLLTLINDVLDLAKVEAGRLELTREPVDIGHAISASVAGLRPLADRKGQVVDVSVEPAIEIDADPGRLRQILYNLLSNAIKYTPDGGSIRMTASRVGDDVRIVVADTGVGIAAGDQARVFEEFRQVGDPSQHQSGTGLGLALTKRLVEAHGGRIEVESVLGAGATFTVSLPDRQAQARAELSRNGRGDVLGDPGRDVLGDVPGNAPSEFDGVDVLVIEDEASSARLLQTYLTDAGYRVRIAPDGETGLELGRALRPAAIVLDILLPGIDGWEVLRRLKSDEALRDVPVIIATVVDERGVGLALGAVDYLVKPVDPKALLDRLDRYAFTSRALTGVMDVLAVDDDPIALDVIDGTLTPLGFNVRRTSSGRQGIELARSTCPDLVICDLLMPDVDGFEVVARLNEDPATAAIPILVLTAHDLSEADKVRLNGRVLGIATKGTHGVDGLTDWLARVLPQGRRIVPPAP